MENLLPKEITLDIFSRLPAESVSQCRQVCKTWGSLLRHPCFPDMHLRRSLQLDKLGLIYFSTYEDYDKHLHYGEYDENDEQSFKTLEWIQNPLIQTRYELVNSCNGLICFSILHHGIVDPIYICNPVTREHVILPILSNDLTMDRKLHRPTVAGFGYVPCTNEYKVVRIYYRRDLKQPRGLVGSVQVYTIGSGSGWRNKGEIMYSPLLQRNYFISSPGILLNGVIHWLDDETMNIVIFDLAGEEFCLLRSPPCYVPGDDNCCQLCLLGGLLCFVRSKTDEAVDIWSLKQRSSNTTCDMTEQEKQSWSWSKDFRIAWEGLVEHEYKSFPFAKCDEILLWYSGMILSRHDPKNATLSMVSSDFLMFEAIPHLNSFVSLKALGEEGVKMIESTEGISKLERLQPFWW